jgi:hypothetical protein
MRLPDRKLLLALVTFAVLVAALALALLLRAEDRPPLEVGARAPEIVGKAVRDGEVDLQRLRGHVVLVSFLNSRAEATTEGDPSRAPIVIRLALVPEDEKTNDPVQVVPRLNSRLSPGANVLPLTVTRLFHGLVDEPLPSAAAAQST